MQIFSRRLLNFSITSRTCAVVFLYLFDVVSSVLVTDPNILPVLSTFLKKQKFSPDVSTTFKKEYDYIVVGAGSGGSVVASRLSEMPCVTVLLLEAGGAPPVLSEIPVAAPALWFTDVDWQFRTVPQRHTGRGLLNREIVMHRGKMLGGSSSINNLLYVRGNKNDYNRWEAQGAKGWSYKDVFPYFKKLEDNRDPDILANGYHNITGPVTVHRPRYEPLLKRTYYEALKGFGFEFGDPNGKRQLGIYDIQGNTRNGQRCSTAKAYLVPAENRENLDIIINAMAKKVLIKVRRAVGVEFDIDGQTYQVSARREVIVSAGSIKTPQLLMLSGIGPKEELSRFKIPVIADLPVGQNYHDHGATLMLYEISKKNPNVILKSTNPGAVLKYIKNRSGPLSSLTYLYYLGWFKGNTTSSSIDIPNYELYFGEATASIITSRFYGLMPEVYEAYLGPYALKPLLLCLVQQVQPRSRGTVKLNSTSIYESPLIDPNYLADRRDEDDMIQGMQMCEQVALSRPLRLLGSQPLKTLIPDCEKYAFEQEKYFRCQLRTVLISAKHSVGSVRMGNPRDPTTVLDPKLRVKTIKGLRVVDGSVMPSVTSGNTNIPIIMIAEKASDMIKETISCRWRNEDVEPSFPQKAPDVKTKESYDWIKESPFLKSEFNNSNENSAFSFV